MESKIIASLDLTDESKLVRMAEEIGQSVFAIKINWPTILSLGKGIIKRLSETSNIICDLKIADIPNTNRLIMEQIATQHPWGVIAHLFTGKDSMESIVKAAVDAKVIGVVAMSNPGASEYLNGNYGNLVEDAKSLGCYGIVAPGNDYNLLERISKMKGNLKIFSPGVGAQGGGYNKALLSGADYVIIGRSLYENPDPIGYIKSLERK